jgi:protein O-GlcNAc transferase
MTGSKTSVTTISNRVPSSIDVKPAPPDTAPIDALLTYALGRHAAGQTAEASRVYEVILTREPANKFALYNLGQIEQTGGNLDGALGRYAKVLALDANYFPAIYNSALAFEAKDDRPSAINYFRRALAADPSSAPARFHLGTILVATGNVDEGQSLVNAALATNPELATR